MGRCLWTYLLIHLSAHLYYHHHSHHPSLLHSFTPGSKPTFSTNPSHLRLLLSTGLPSWQRDWTGPIMLIVLFIVSHFNFLFVPCGGLSWLPVSFLLHVKYTVSYRIVSYWRHRYRENSTENLAISRRSLVAMHRVNGYVRKQTRGMSFTFISARMNNKIQLHYHSYPCWIYTKIQNSFHHLWRHVKGGASKL